MKEVRKSTQFKKDFKRFKNNIEFVEILFQLVCMLAEGKPISPFEWRQAQSDTAVGNKQ